MSQKLNFWKTKIFTEEVTQDFSSESIHKALISLLQGTELHSSEYREKYFENIVTSLSLNDDQLDKIAPKYRKKLKYVLFDPQKITFFMMDDEVWKIIQSLVESSIKNTINDENKNLENRLKTIARIGKDYDNLSSLFQKRMLFAGIF